MIHRDLKPENIFISSLGYVKVGDFGVSRILSNAENRASTVVGTYEYLAPEMIKEEPYDNKVDIWALGVILYELVAGYRPFDGRNFVLMNNIINNPFKKMPDGVDGEIRELIGKMLSKDAEKRPSIKEVLRSKVVMPYIE